MLLIDRIGELLTMDSNDGKAIRGEMMSLPGIITDSAIVVDGEKIVDYGKRNDILKNYGDKITTSVDAENSLVTPGLVDPHTHAVFLGTRETEFEMRLKGKSYMEIANTGGGILNTVKQVRKSDEDTLVQKSLLRFEQMLSNGITTVEVKSGYGLSVESELKMLNVIKKLRELVPQDIVPTFLGAHEIPDEYRPDRKSEYIDSIINEMIPQVANERLAKFCDVFCEKGVFDIEDTGRILTAAKENGLGLKMHADEIEPMGGTELGVSLGARSVDHLGAISDFGIVLLAQSETAAVFLPGTTFFLGLEKYAPARQLIGSGAIVALATDFNPGSSPTTNLPMIMSIACMQMKLTPTEVWAAATINAAYAIGLEFMVGSITKGKYADIAIWNAENHKQIPYFYGEKLVKIVIKRGKVLWHS
ncbi:imidazolonepropionase [bacterium]|nr:imidazolonepropionase [bacterium]